MRPDIHFRPFNIRTETPTTNARRVYVAHASGEPGLAASALLDPEAETAPKWDAPAQIWEIPTTPTASLQARRSSSLGAQFVSGPWGWLPLLSLTSGIGLMIFALANNASRSAQQWADPLFWLGLVVIFLPIALRLLISPHVTRRERIGLLLLAGISLYLAKYLEAPLVFGLYDEYLHWRTAQDIALTHHLFATNPLLPISATFPGLEIATNALSSLSGASIFVSGLIVVGVARIILTLALYLFLALLLGSERLAGIATLVYFCNPHLLYFDAAFSYESLALPLALLVIFGILRHMRARSGERVGLLLVIFVAIAAVAVTHHVTSYVLVGFLVAWALLSLFGRLKRGASHAGYPIAAVWVAPLGVALCVGIFWFARTTITHYLGPDLNNALNQISGLIEGTSAPRQLFHDSTGNQAAQWERIAATGSVLVIIAALPFGWLRIWRRRMLNPLMILMVLASAIYIVMVPLRFSQQAAEFGDRANAFLFIGIGVVVAIGAERLLLAWNLRRVAAFGRVALLTSWVALMFVGGVVAGAGPIWSRMPGPYLVGADPRSITPEGIDAALWARDHLGTQNRFATDRVNSLLMDTYGEQVPLAYLTRALQVADMFTSAQIDPAYGDVISSGWIQYIEVDQRLSTGLPRFGYYFNSGESQANRYTTPIPVSALDKFDGAAGINRIFDSGNIAIYAGVLTNAG